MSSDAKIWSDNGDWVSWSGIHEGPCDDPSGDHTLHNLGAVILSIEDCMGQELRWEITLHPDGAFLRGFRT